MKTRIVLVFVFAFANISFAAQSPKWSPEQQEVIDHIIGAWNAWMEAVEKNNPEIWTARAPTIEGGASWWLTTTGAPRDIAAWFRRNIALVREEAPKWIDLRPLAVIVHGDVAVVQFYGYWQYTTKTGREVVEQKRMEVFKKIAGKWTLLAGQVTPVSKPDSDR
jgi:hypothetical protein